MGDSRRREEAPGVVSRLGVNEVSQLVVYMLRQPFVTRMAIADLSPDCFDREPQYRLLWKCALGVAAAYGGEIVKDALYHAVALAVEELPTRMAPAAEAELLCTLDDVGCPLVVDDPDAGVVTRPGIIWRAFADYDADDFNELYGVALLKRFLRERTVVDAVKRAMDVAGDKTPTNFADMLGEMTKRSARIDGIGGSNVVSFDSLPEFMEVKEPYTSGNPVFDYFMDGGQCVGELIAHFQPQKGGKTFTCIDQVVNVAGYFDRLQRDGGEELYVNYMFYEMSPKEIKDRVFSRGGDVDYDRLQYKIRTHNDYSRAGSLLDYEIQMYKDRRVPNRDDLPGEFERLSAFNAGPGRWIRAVDMRATGDSSLGTMLTDGVVSHLDNEIAGGRRPGMVIIDYAGYAVRNYLYAKGMDPDRHTRSTLVRFFAELVNVAAKYNVPVWVVHQFSANMQKAAPSYTPSTTDASEARTLGENAQFTFCGGKPLKIGRERQVSTMSCDLSRRGGHGGEQRIMGLEYRFGRVSDVTDRYVVNQSMGTIEERVAAAVRVPTAVKESRRPPTGGNVFKDAEGVEDDSCY